MSSSLSEDELDKIGFKSLRKNVLLGKWVMIYSL
jgi:hypothetical protein